MSEIAELDLWRDALRARLPGGDVTLEEILALHQAYAAHGAGAPLDLEEEGLRLLLRDHRPDDADAIRRYCEVLERQGKPIPEAYAGRVAAPPPAQADSLDHTAAQLAQAQGGSAELISALKLVPPTPRATTPSSLIGGLAPEVRRLVEESLAGRYETAERVVAELGEAAPGDLSPTDLDRLVVALALRRGVPLDLIEGVVAAGHDLDARGPYQALWNAAFRRVGHWRDLCRLLALYRRRRFDGVGQADAAVEAAAQSLETENYAELGSLLTADQAAEVVDYFRDRPGYSTHVPDGRPDPVRRYLGQGADDYPFCSYPFSDVALAPHLMEAVLTPKIAEIGRRHFGAIPRLQKLYAHWDLPGSKRLWPGTSISHLHRDLNDFGMLWLYLYLTDVDAESGPHALVPGSHDLSRLMARLDDARRRNAPLRFMDRDLNALDLLDGYGYQIDAGVKEAVFGPALKVFTGPAGTAFLSGGLNLHQIVNPQTKPRLILAARFTLNPFPAPAAAQDDDPIPGRLIARRVGDTPLIREMTAVAADWSRS